MNGWKEGMEEGHGYLKVATDYEQVDSRPAFDCTTFFHRSVDCVESSMALRI